ncbi:MAG: TIR domain-containing protein [Gammaproteobacteria bacterium]
MTTRSTLRASTEFEVFISYARKDDAVQPGESSHEGWISWLHRLLLAEQANYTTEPLRIFFDTQHIHDMDDWRHRIQGAVRDSRVLLACISPNYFASIYCAWEWEEHQRHQVHQLIGFDSIAAVQLLATKPAEQESEALSRWRTQLDRVHTTTDLRSYLARGTEPSTPGMRDEFAGAIAKLGLALWERIKRARRAHDVTGNLPRLSPHFVGRKPELIAMHDSVSFGARDVVTVLHGLGGQGKTELATAYARSHADTFAAGLWLLSAEGKTDLVALFGELVPDLGLTASYTTPTERGRHVLAELERRVRDLRERDPAAGCRCFVLLDNVSEPELLSAIQLQDVKAENWLRIVATTRLGPEDLKAQEFKFVAVEELSFDDGLALLREHRRGSAQDVAEQDLPEDESALQELVRELAGFTLALQQVALHLSLRSRVRPRDYLARLRKEGLPSTDALPFEGKGQVALQIKHREKKLSTILDDTLATLTPLENATLEYAALLPSDQVVWPWLRDALTPRFGSELTVEQGYDDTWQTVMRRLEGLCFLISGDKPQLARMHPLISAHLSTRLQSDRETRQAEMQSVVATWAQALAAQWEHTPGALWLLPALEAYVDHASTPRNKHLSSVAQLLAECEEEHGTISEAVRYADLACSILVSSADGSRVALGSAADIARAKARLAKALVIRAQPGDNDCALEAFEASLQLREIAHLRDSSSALTARELSDSLDHLADVLAERGGPNDLATAIAYAERSVQLCDEIVVKTASDGAHRDLCISLIKLSDALQRTAHSDDRIRAQALLERSLELAEQVRSNNPESAQAIGDVAFSHNKLGQCLLVSEQSPDLERALKHFQGALAAREQLLQRLPNSPQSQRVVALSLDRVAECLARRAQPGDLEQAITLVKRGFALRKAVLQLDPSAARSRHDVGVSLLLLGQLLFDSEPSKNLEQALSCLQGAQNLFTENLKADSDSAYKRSVLIKCQRFFGTLLLARDSTSADLDSVLWLRASNVRLGADSIQRGIVWIGAQAGLDEDIAWLTREIARVKALLGTTSVERLPDSTTTKVLREASEKLEHLAHHEFQSAQQQRDAEHEYLLLNAMGYLGEASAIRDLLRKLTPDDIENARSLADTCEHFALVAQCRDPEPIELIGMAREQCLVTRKFIISRTGTAQSVYELAGALMNTARLHHSDPDPDQRAQSHARLLEAQELLDLLRDNAGELPEQARELDRLVREALTRFDAAST